MEVTRALNPPLVKSRCCFMDNLKATKFTVELEVNFYGISIHLWHITVPKLYTELLKKLL